MSDPTEKLVDSIRKRSKSDWGKIIEDVPIFVAHRWFERDTQYGKEAKTVLAGDEEPDPKEGWKFVYEVTERDLEAIKEEAAKQFEQHNTPMKLIVGHTRPGAPQEQQPQLVGFAAHPKMGEFGKNRVKCLQATHFYRKGYEECAAEYPQRSPEYKRSANRISAIALLKTDPRLPLGFHSYEDEFFYGEGFMADESTSGAVKTPETPHDNATQTKPNTSTEMATELAPLEPHERHFADRVMKHYAENCAPMKYLHEQHKKYADSQAAMATASPNSGRTPATPIGGEAGTPASKPEGTSEDYMDSELQRQYEENQKFLLEENAKLYAEQEFQKMLQLGVKKSTLANFKDRIVKIRVNAQDNKSRDEQTKEYLDEVKNNYARESRPPVSRDFLPIRHDEPADAPRDTDDIQINDPETVSAITRYAEDNKIDIVNSSDGWQKAVNGYAAMKKKTA